jgi:hypothetical protein
MQGSKAYQFAHLVRPTDILYRDLWVHPNNTVGGLWVPLYWVRARFQLPAAGSALFRTGLLVQPCLRRPLGGLLLLGACAAALFAVLLCHTTHVRCGL